jgi:alkylation response protein AidB-like acyl-CoA dehydrogenase
VTGDRSETGLAEFRDHVRQWCAEHVPTDWRAAQTGASDEQFVAFQKSWFAELHAAGFAVPHWPAEWGGGMPVAEQIVLYQELAAHDAPRLVLAFVGIHHAASTLLVAGTEEQRRQHLPAILDGEIWVQGFSEPEAGSDLAALRTTARRDGDAFVVNGQKLWASGGMHADWCLLLARTDPEAPKRKGISYFLMDMTSPGIDVRPIRNAVGDSHFCEVFLNDVVIPERNLIGAENAGWQVAQATLGAERGMTMLELAERLGNAGFRWLVAEAARTRPDGHRPLDDAAVGDRLARLETEIAGLRGLCRRVVEGHDGDAVGPADPSIVKLFYSELLQRLSDFGVEIGGLDAHTVLTKPMSSGWESGAWVLDFIGSWEWTIPGGASEIQRTIIAERGLGMPRDPVAS